MRTVVLIALPFALGLSTAACDVPTRAPRAATDVVASAGAGCREGELEQCVVACANGSTESCNEAGRAYELGVGVGKSGMAANTYYRKACDLGDATGCYNAGYLLENGLAGRRDIGCALALYRLACGAGHTQGCLSAGHIYREGAPEVPRDKAQAVEHFRKACDAGNTSGCQQVEKLESKAD